MVLLAAVAATQLGLFPASAIAKDLRGDAFITAMEGNTLAGKDANGNPFKVYFVPGGQVSYQEGSGNPQFGSWNLDKNGDVCVKWAPGASMESGCFRVAIQGDKVTWSNKDGTHQGGLTGGVAPLTMSKGQ
jgi:hypothetical protein